MAFCGSLMASPTVGPDIRAMTGPRLTSLLRSHSQTLSRAGLPKLVRKPSGSWVWPSASWAARVPLGTPGMLGIEPVTANTESNSTSAGSRRALAWL